MGDELDDILAVEDRARDELSALQKSERKLIDTIKFFEGSTLSNGEKVADNEYAMHLPNFDVRLYRAPDKDYGCEVNELTIVYRNEKVLDVVYKFDKLTNKLRYQVGSYVGGPWRREADRLMGGVSVKNIEKMNREIGEKRLSLGNYR